MRCPGRMVLHEAPPESQLLPVTHTFTSPPLLASAFPSQSASVRALCSDRLFLGGNLSRGSTVWPSCLETHPPQCTHTHTHTHTSAHPSRFRGPQRPLPTHTQGREHAHYPPPTSPSGSLTPSFSVVVKSTWCSGLKPWLHLTLLLQAWGIQATPRKNKEKEQSFISRNSKWTNQPLPKTKKNSFIPKSNKKNRRFLLCKIHMFVRREPFHPVLQWK